MRPVFYLGGDLEQLEALARQLVKNPKLKGALERDLQNRLSRVSLIEYVKTVTPGYKAGWFAEEVCAGLELFAEDVIAGKDPRQMYMAPPRHGKTEIVGRKFPLWFMGRWPKVRGSLVEYVCASYSPDLAAKISESAKAASRSPRSAEIFPGLLPTRISNKSKGKLTTAAPRYDRGSFWSTATGGTFMSCGVKTPLTGSGALILSIDDPVKDAEQAQSATESRKTWEWYQTVSMTRVAPGGGILLTQTPWHVSDLRGRILEADKRSKRWRVARFPAIAEKEADCVRPDWMAARLGPRRYREIGEALDPARWPLSRLHEIREVMRGGKWWLALYQCRPQGETGSTFPTEKINRYDFDPQRAEFDEVIISVDPNFRKGEGNDPAVIAVWGFRGSKKFILDIWKGSVPYPVLRRRFVEMCRRWPEAYAKLIEGRANGDALCDDLSDVIDGIIRIEPRNTADRKLKDAEIAALYFDNGEIYAPIGLDWAEEWIEEHTKFPGGGHDDQVDTTSQVLLWRAKQARQYDPQEETNALLEILGISL